MKRVAAVHQRQLALDAFDVKILATLQREGRITKLALAERVGLSPSPCWERLRRLERTGIIAEFRARLSLRILAPASSFFTEVTLHRHRRDDFDRFERAVQPIAEITECWAVGGGVDYILKLVTPDVDYYQRLIERLLAADIGIDRYFTYIVTKPVKDSGELPLNALLVERSLGN